MFGGEHKLLTAVQDKPSTKWHNIRDRFRYLFNSEHVDNIEKWYNTIAPRRQRDWFREVVKGIHLHDPQPAPDALTQHKAEHIMRLYGDLFTAQGQTKAKSWIMQTGGTSGERFKDVFAAAQATLTNVSTMKRTFVVRELPEVQPKAHNRKKVDWERSQTAETVRNMNSNPMDNHANVHKLEKPVKRLTKPKGQFDGASENIMKSLKITKDDLDNLQEKRKDFDRANTYQVLGDGSTSYKTKQASKAMAATSNRIVVTSQGNSAVSWISTSRELLRHPGVRTAEFVSADKHPAIARTTASLGFCVPHADE